MAASIYDFFGISNPGQASFYSPGVVYATDFPAYDPGKYLADVTGGFTPTPVAARTSGYTFTPQPLTIGSVTYPTQIGFNFPLPSNTTDQVAEAYQYSARSLAGAYDFVAQSQRQTLAFDQPFFEGTAGAMAQIGNGLVAALQTAANNLKQKKGGIFGFLFG